MIPSNKYETHFFDKKCQKLKCQEAVQENKKELSSHQNTTTNTTREIENIRSIYSNEFNMTQLKNNSDLLSFEKTPIYLFHPYVAARIQTILPWSKIIMLLRDPVDRANSAFKMKYVRYGIAKKEHKYGKISFETCVNLDVKKLTEAGILNNNDFWKVDDSERERRWLKYWMTLKRDFLTRKAVCDGEIGRGLYYMQIQRWFKEYNAIEDRKKIFIIKSEHLLPEGATHRVDFKPITDFIGIDAMEITAEKKIHATADMGPMKKETKQKLRNLFDPFNKKLFSVLGNGWEDPWSYDDVNM